LPPGFLKSGSNMSSTDAKRAWANTNGRR
jgi:hypothetical protein